MIPLYTVDDYAVLIKNAREITADRKNRVGDVFDVFKFHVIAEIVELKANDKNIPELVDSLRRRNNLGDLSRDRDAAKFVKNIIYKKWYRDLRRHIFKIPMIQYIKEIGDREDGVMRDALANILCEHDVAEFERRINEFLDAADYGWMDRASKGTFIWSLDNK